MADSLVLKGVKEVRKQTGSELLRLNPKRGGDTHQIKRWWTPNTVSTVYVACTVFKCTQGGSVAHLAVETASTTTIRITVDDGFQFNFYNNTGVKRAALLDENMAVIEHYVFPAISGGKIMTVTPPGASSRPSPSNPLSFTSQATIAGTPTVGETLTATAATYTGGVGSVSTNLIFQVSDTGSSGWTFLAGNPGTAAGATATYEVQAADVSKYIRASYQVTDDNETKSSNSAATAEIAATFSMRVASADVTVVVTENGGEYEIDGVANAEITANVGDTIVFDLSDASLSGHPLAIFTDSSKTTPVTVGVEVSDDGNTLLFTPPIAGTFSYQCINHADMGGDIVIS